MSETPEAVLREAIEFAYGGGGSKREPALQALASLRQRQEELEREARPQDKNESQRTVAELSDLVASLRTQLQQAEQEAAARTEDALNMAMQARAAEDQLQQAETALAAYEQAIRGALKRYDDEDAGVLASRPGLAWAMASDLHAALAAPPPNTKGTEDG